MKRSRWVGTDACTVLTCSFSWWQSDRTNFIQLLCVHSLHSSNFDLLTSSFLRSSDSTYYILHTSLWKHSLHSLWYHFLHPSYFALTTQFMRVLHPLSALTSSLLYVHSIATGMHFATLPMRLLSAEMLQLRQWWHVLGLHTMPMPSGPVLAASPSDPFAVCLCALRLHR